MATLKLPQSPRARVYREVLAVLRDDPTLRVVDQWRGDGRNPADRTATARAKGVVVATRMRPGEASWYGPSGTIGPIVVDFTLEVEGCDPDDVPNLWYAIERAFYPPDDARRMAIQARLVRAGADTGEPLFSTPADDPDETPDANRWAAMGRLQLDVIHTLNP